MFRITSNVCINDNNFRKLLSRAYINNVSQKSNWAIVIRYEADTNNFRKDELEFRRRIVLRKDKSMTSSVFCSSGQMGWCRLAYSASWPVHWLSVEFTHTPIRSPNNAITQKTRWFLAPTRNIYRHARSLRIQSASKMTDLKQLVIIIIQ